MNNLLNKFLGMNSGTRERTVVSIVIYVLNFLVVFHIVEFSDEQIQAIAQVVAIAAVGIAWCISHYKNNDFTEVAAKYTGLMRLEKEVEKEDYVGENFFEEYEEPIIDEDFNEDEFTDEEGESDE